MAKDQLLTRAVLIKTLKELGMVTMDGLKKGLGGLERKLVIRMNKMERSLRQSIADLAETTPTREEFETLKQRVSGKYGFV